MAEPETAKETPKEPEMEVRMSFGEHLEELRKRLVRSLVCLLVVIVGLMFFYEDMLRWITAPHYQAMDMLGFEREEVTFLVKAPHSTMLASMKMAFIFGLFICSPVIGYQMWAFVAAGLYRTEKKYIVRFAPISFLLFTTGCAFGYFILIPYALFGLASMSNVQLGPKAEAAVEEKAESSKEDPDAKKKEPGGEGEGASPEPAPKKEPQAAPPKNGDTAPPKGGDPKKTSGTDPPGDDAPKKEEATAAEEKAQEGAKETPLLKFMYQLPDYLNLVLLLTIILGAIFQLPLIMVFLVKIGVATPATYNKWRRAAVIFNVCFAALVTPADIFTMLIVSAPMLVLYEIGVIISYIVARKAKPAAAS